MSGTQPTPSPGCDILAAMADLRLVGVSDDGSRLILQREDGDAEHLPVDERLRSMVGSKKSGSSKPAAVDLETRLSPREIQARIRSGQTPEEVADDAGISVERVERFAGPILHEREYIAQEAAKVGVRRDDHGAVMLLGELVGQRLEQRGVPRDGMQWDAWRRDDGGWEVRLDYQAGGRERSANWVYDPARKTVTADDDDAQRLLEDEQPASVTQLRSVPSRADAVSERDAAAQPAAEAEQASDASDDAVAAEAAAPSRRAASGARSGPRVQKGTQDAIDALMRGRETVPDPPAPKRNKKKASVPSWDEILFGSRKPE